MIVKCQRSLHTTEPEPQMLIYNKARDRQWMMPVTPEWQKLFDRFGPKFFANVKVRKTRPPEFVRKVIDLDW